MDTKSNGEQLQLQSWKSKSGKNVDGNGELSEGYTVDKTDGTKASNGFTFERGKTISESSIIDDDDYKNRSFKGIQLQPDKKTLIGEAGTMASIMKANLGTGILALPQGFFFSGLYLGLVLVPLIGFLAIYCMHLMVRSSRELCTRLSVFSLSMDETVGAAFSTGPKDIRFCGPILAGVTKFFIITTQIGFLCVFYEFITENLRQVLECSTETHVQPRYVYCLALLPLLMVMNSMKQLKSLGYVSLLANFAMISVISIIVYYSIKDRGPGNIGTPATKAPEFGELKNIPLFFGIAVFAFEGISLVLPVEHKMKEPSSFLAWNGLLNVPMTLVLLLYMTVGYYGCLHYGSTVRGSITLSLPSTDKLALGGKILVALAILLTYPLQAYVVVEYFVEYHEKRGLTKNLRAKEYVLRYGIVTFSCICAILVPSLGLFISLVGSLFGTFLALILPPLVHLITFWDQHSYRKMTIIKALFIIVFGILGSISGSISAITEIAHSMEDPAHQKGVQCSV